MLGKASEIKTLELWYSKFESWQEENPEFIIIDIKYSLGTDDNAAILIIYKEGESNAHTD